MIYKHSYLPNSLSDELARTTGLKAAAKVEQNLLKLEVAHHLANTSIEARVWDSPSDQGRHAVACETIYKRMKEKLGRSGDISKAIEHLVSTTPPTATEQNPWTLAKILECGWHKNQTMPTETNKLCRLLAMPDEQCSNPLSTQIIPSIEQGAAWSLEVAGAARSYLNKHNINTEIRCRP